MAATASLALSRACGQQVLMWIASWLLRGGRTDEGRSTCRRFGTDNVARELAAVGDCRVGSGAGSHGAVQLRGRLVRSAEGRVRQDHRAEGRLHPPYRRRK